MSFAGPSRGVKNEINVTPLVDVVLVLLIIFMVVMPTLQQGRDLRLPKARGSEDNTKVDALIIAIPADRSIWFESTQVGHEGLRAAVMATLHKDPGRKILIKADESLQVKDVRLVMAEAEAAGAHGVSFAVEAVKR